MQNLELLAELEILFLSFTEIAALEYCPNLKKLSCKIIFNYIFYLFFFIFETFIVIDNGLLKISNLSPVSITLTKLCICDQVIIKL
jgi:hypothetical protein